MPELTASDLERMRRGLFFDGPDRKDKLSRFWVLLSLAAVIASAGVVSDSTATVIGAMIVAPLMTPIMGAVLAITTSDRDNLVRCLAMILGGALISIAIGYVFGMLTWINAVAATSSQVAARVNPRLIDLVAAIATGAVGAFAQCREDVSDTLPGVAIAISLVPPLAVVGLTLEGGEPGQAWGALLLFLTNVAAILLTGVVVMALYRVHLRSFAVERPLNRRRAVRIVVALVAAIAIPLGAATVRVTNDTIRSARIAEVATAWAESGDWTVVNVGRMDGSSINVVATGPLPSPEPASLRAALDRAGYEKIDVTLRLIPEARVRLEGN